MPLIHPHKDTQYPLSLHKSYIPSLDQVGKAVTIDPAWYGWAPAKASGIAEGGEMTLQPARYDRHAVVWFHDFITVGVETVEGNQDRWVGVLDSGFGRQSDDRCVF